MSDPRLPLLERFRTTRNATQDLCDVLSPEDCLAQSMDDASPAKWHLAHTSWFFETFILERVYAGYRHFEPEFRVLFNSYYQGVGPQHPRPERGLLTRPSLDEVLAYRDHVDGHIDKILSGDSEPDPAILPLIRLGIEHEQQHQELLLTDVKHLFSRNPLRPAYRQIPATPVSATQAHRWCGHGGRIAWIGQQDAEFAFDNESPRHRVIVEDFELGSRLIVNEEFQAFIADGGYQRPELWLSEGWDTVAREGWNAPLYWEERDGVWSSLTLGGLRPVVASEPVCHVSLFEADAFARWSGARLPTEQEWEIAAERIPVSGNFVEAGFLHPQPAGTSAAATGPVQMFGDVWEWTQSPYSPYPGFHPPSGAVGEYNGKFMSGQIVLRGGSCATPASHMRATYRNFFPPSARWQFSGIRLARDV